MKTGAITGKVWKDVNQNFEIDGFDTALAGIPLALWEEGSERIIRTTVSGPDGKYIFDNLTIGETYFVVRGDAAGKYVQYAKYDRIALSEPIYIEEPVTIVSDVGFRDTSSSTKVDIDIGMVSGRVWKDVDSNGLQNTDEQALAGVRVELVTASGESVFRTITGPDGSYLFDAVPPGVYSVRFDEASPVLQGMKFTAANMGSNETSDSDVIGDGKTATFLVEAGKVYSQDAGVTSTAGLKNASLSGMVFLDVDSNAVNGVVDAGIANVGVVLRDDAGNEVATTTTDRNGAYVFRGLGAGKYVVQFVETSAPLKGLLLVAADQGGNDTVDSDVIDKSLNSTGVMTLKAGEAKINVDAGYTHPQTAAVIGGQNTGKTQEDGSLTSRGQLTVSDVNYGEAVFKAGEQTGIYGKLSIAADGSWTYRLDNTAAHVQALTAADTKTDAFTVQSADGTPQVITVSVLGMDEKSIGGKLSGRVIEDVSATAVGQVSGSDARGSALTFNADTTAGVFGKLVMTADGSWTYQLDNTKAQSLRGGEVVNELFAITSTDGQEVTITVAVSGTNDAPVISGISTGSLTEGNGMAVTTSGTLTVADADRDESGTKPGNYSGSYGTVNLDASGKWVYTLDPNNSAAKNLNNGQSVTEKVSILTADGVTQFIVITINGSTLVAVDTARISGQAWLDNDGSKTWTGGDAIKGGIAVDLYKANADGSPNMGAGKVASAVTDGSGSYSFSNLAAGKYVLDFNESQLPAGYKFFNAENSRIAAGQEASGLSQVIELAAGQEVKWFNVSANEVFAPAAAVIVGTTSGHVQEDTNPSASGKLSVTDINTGEAVFKAGEQTGAYGKLVLAADGTWTYTLNNSAANVQALRTSETKTENFTVQSADGTRQVIVVNVQGLDEKPSLGGKLTGVTAEDGTQVATGQITGNDTSAAAVKFVPSETPGVYGKLVVTATGVWTYQLDNAKAQSLKGSNVATELFEIVTVDGQKTTVTVTVNGANDKPTIAGTTSGSLTENNGAGGMTASGSITVTDIDRDESGTKAGNYSGSYGSVALDAAGKWVYTLDPANAAVKNLNDGQSLADKVVIQATDGSTQTIHITINGSTAEPLSTPASLSGMIFKDANGNGVREAGDAGMADVIVQLRDMSIPNGINGNWKANVVQEVKTDANGVYIFNNLAPGNYKVDLAEYGSDSALRYLNALGELNPLKGMTMVTANQGSSDAVDSDLVDRSNHMTDVITIKAGDKVINVDAGYIPVQTAAVIGGATSGKVQEDVSPSTTGKLTVTDINPGEATFKAGEQTGTYGKLVVAADGTWTYTLNNSASNVQALMTSSKQVETFTVQSADGTRQAITIDVQGVDEKQSFGGQLSGSVTEDGSSTVVGQITGNDVFGGGLRFPVREEAGTLGKLSLGSDGRWTYQLDNAKAQVLKSGEVVSETFLISSADGQKISITVNVNGTNDAPVISGTQTATLVENNGGGVVTASGTLVAMDVDRGESSMKPGTYNGSHGSVSLDASGKWVYTLDSNSTAVKNLNDGQSLIDKVAITAADGSVQFISVTINGSTAVPVDTASIMGQVWLDNDGSKTWTGGDAIKGGIAVDLYKANLDGSPNVGAGKVASMVTDGSGTYRFNNLAAGKYVIDFNENQLPAGYKFFNAANSNVATGQEAAGWSTVVDLAKAQEVKWFNAGAYVPAPVEPPATASVSGKVWNDANNNGVQDAGESGIAGVSVDLRIAGTTTSVAQTTTDANGNYVFNNVKAGNYFADFGETSAAIAGRKFSKQDQGVDDTRDSDVINTGGWTNNFNVVGGTTVSNMDAGVVPNAPIDPKTASLSGQVWIDGDKNNSWTDGTDRLLNDVRVDLYRATADGVADVAAGIVATTTTSTGTYKFSGLAAGQYVVDFNESQLPTDYKFVASAVSVIADASNSGMSKPVTLGIGEAREWFTGQAVYSVDPANASLSGMVFKDVNADDVRNGEDRAVANVSVALRDAAGTVLQTTVTDAKGQYSFKGLKAGNYVVDFDEKNPAFSGWILVGANRGGNADIDSDVTETKTHATSVIALAASEAKTNVDAGYTFAPMVTVSGKVWNDANGDGIQNAGEAGIEGVRVDLRPAGSSESSLYSVTNANGEYIFLDVRDGTYALDVDEFSAPIKGKSFSKADQGGDDTRDSDVINAAGQMHTVTVASASVSHVDVGVIGMAPLDNATASLSGMVFKDANTNGVREVGDSGIAKVGVELRDAAGALLKTTMTDASGKYSFAGLKAGNYVVDFVENSGALNGLKLVAADQGGNDATDSDASNSSWNATGVIALAIGEAKGNVDAGYAEPAPVAPALPAAPTGPTAPADSANASLSGMVFKDVNNNGVRDAGDLGIAKVAVELRDAAGVLIRTTITDPDGKYSFTGLKAGNYVVDFAEKSPALDRFRLSVAEQGGNDSVDSDVTNANTHATSVIALAAGEAKVSVDAGYALKPLGTSSITDSVYVDTNNNGIQDGCEGGIVGAKLQLLKADGTAMLDMLGQPMVATTGADGKYMFAGLPEGSYMVRVSPSSLLGAHYKAWDGTAMVDKTIDGNLNGFTQIGEKVYPITKESAVVSSSSTTSAFTIGDGVQVTGKDFGVSLESTVYVAGTLGQTVGYSLDGGAAQVIRAGFLMGTYNGAWLEALCVEVKQGMKGSETMHSYNEVTISSYFGSSAEGLRTANNLLKLYANFVDEAAADKTGFKAAALQLAAWEIVEERGDAYNMDSGHFAAKALTSKEEAKMAELKTLAKSWLDQVESGTLGDKGKHLEVFTSPESQDQVSLVSNYPTESTPSADASVTSPVGGAPSVAASTPAPVGVPAPVPTPAPTPAPAPLPGSVSGNVWVDHDKSGAAWTDPDWMVKGGVRVNLYLATADGKLDLASGIQQTTITDGNGSYKFSGLQPNVKYVLDFDESQLPKGHQFVSGQGAIADASNSGWTKAFTLASGENKVGWDVQAQPLNGTLAGQNVFMTRWYSSIVPDPTAGNIQNSMVVLYKSTNGTNSGGTWVGDYPVDGKGFFVISLPPGDYYFDTDSGGLADSLGTRSDVYTVSPGELNVANNSWIMVSPVAIDLDNSGAIETTSVAGGVAGAQFDLLGTGDKVRSGWLAKGDGFLVIDTNHNGKIDNVNEMFGGAVGAGFAKFAKYDTNGDGIININDGESFLQLKVWQDGNGDRITDPGELKALADVGIVSLKVSYEIDPSTDGTGNIVIEKSTAVMADGREVLVGDVYFHVDSGNLSAANVAALVQQMQASAEYVATLSAHDQAKIADVIEQAANDVQASSLGDPQIAVDTHDVQGNDAAINSGAAISHGILAEALNVTLTHLGDAHFAAKTLNGQDSLAAGAQNLNLADLLPGAGSGQVDLGALLNQSHGGKTVDAFAKSSAKAHSEAWMQEAHSALGENHAQTVLSELAKLSRALKDHGHHD